MYNPDEMVKPEDEFIRGILYGSPLSNGETVKVVGKLKLGGKEIPNAYTVDSQNKDMFVYSLQDFEALYKDYVRLYKQHNLILGVLKGRISVDAENTEIADRLNKLELEVCRNQLQLIAEIMVGV